jgi:hypothetical protein
VSGRRFRVEAQEEVELRIPLFVLAAADVAGCTASVTTTVKKGGALKWGITVFGTGLAASAKISVTASSRFTASSGETKVVFLPASITVERGTMLRNGQAIGHGTRVDASNLKQSGAPALLLSPKGARPAIGAIAERYDLAGDTSGAVATYEYLYERSGGAELTLGAKAFGVDLSLTGTIELYESLTLTYGLAGGADYELHQVREGCGLVWASRA